MESIVAGVVGVAGVLLGAAVTHRLQRTSAREERAWRDRESRRGEVLAASADYAAAVSRVKRAAVALRLAGDASPERRRLHSESDRLGAEAEAARFRLAVLLGDARALVAADEAFAAAGAVRGTQDQAGLVEAERHFDAAVAQFASVVRDLLEIA